MRLRRLAFLPLALALVLAACSGDDSSKGASGTGAAGTEATSGTTPQVPAGFTEIDRSEDGFVIALPPGWKDFQLTSSDVDQLSQIVQEVSPNLRPAKVTTTGNVDLNSLTAGAQIEGATLAAGDRVEVAKQTDQTQNGVYLVQASGPPTREASVADSLRNLIEQGGVLYAVDQSGKSSTFTTNVNLIKVSRDNTAVDQLTAQAQLAAAGATDISVTRVALPSGNAVRFAYSLPVKLSDGTKVNIAGLQVYVPTAKDLYVITFSTDQPDKYSQTFDQILATFGLV